MNKIENNQFIMQPKLRSGVYVKQTNSSISVNYRQQSCDLELKNIEANLIGKFLQDLVVGDKSINQLKNSHPTICETIDNLLDELDKLGLLTASEILLPNNIISGEEFYYDILEFASKVRKKTCQSKFFNMMKEGALPKSVMIGYALEYYYLVRLAPSLIASSIAAADSLIVQKCLQEFFISELNHDSMLAESLSSVGIKIKNLAYLQPLPSTFALCSSLGVYSKQHLLSFKSMLFLFEIPSNDFNEVLIQYCQKVGLSDAFYNPLLKHANINDELDHDNISYSLLKIVSAISQEEQIIVKKHLALIIETMAWQENEIISYYANTNNVIPRIF